MTDETTVWRKGDDTADLIRLLERARDVEVRVTATHEYRRSTATHEAVPVPLPHGYWAVGGVAVLEPNPVSTLTSVTSPEPVQPAWLPKGAEDGDWLCHPSSSQVAQWLDGKLVWLAGTEARDFSGWHIWPVWAEVKAERERLEDALKSFMAAVDSRTAEVERLSTVTDEMEEAGVGASNKVGYYPAPRVVRAALTAALAKRDEGQK